MTTSMPPLTGSQFRVVHASSGIIGRVLAETPAWRQSLEGLRALDKLSQPVAASADPSTQLADAMSTAALSGELTEGQFDSLAAELVTKQVGRELFLRAFAVARQGFIQTMDAAVSSSWDSLFGAVQSELEDVLSAASALPKLAQLASAEAAVAAGRVDDLEAWRELVARHAAARRAQQLLLTYTTAQTGTHVEALYLKGVDRTWPDWAQWMVEGVATDEETGEQTFLQPPWPTDRRQGISAEVAAGEGFLRWAIQAGAEVWVPSRPQLERESARLSDVIATAEPNQPRQVRM